MACHAGTGWGAETPDQLPELVSLLKRYPKLWGDTAVLGTAGRVRDFGRLLDGDKAAEDQQLIRSRLLRRWRTPEQRVSKLSASVWATDRCFAAMGDVTGAV